MIGITEKVVFYDPENIETWPKSENDGEFVLCRMIGGGIGKGRYPYEVCATKAFKNKRNDVEAWTRIPQVLIDVKKIPVCCECNTVIVNNEPYMVLVGEIYCKECVRKLRRKIK